MSVIGLRCHIKSSELAYGFLLRIGSFAVFTKWLFFSCRPSPIWYRQRLFIGREQDALLLVRIIEVL